jgi:hypothetical protein
MPMRVRYRKSCGDDPNDTLNDKDTEPQMTRMPVYDDSCRINNQTFWMSDYSQPSQDDRPSLNDDVITPIRAVSSIDDIDNLSKIHMVSRFGCEKSV